MKKKIVLYFSLTFIGSWLLWLPTVLFAEGIDIPSFLLFLGMFAGFVPSTVGLIMLKKEMGDGFKTHLKEILSFSFSKKWLLIILIFPLQGLLSLEIVQQLDKSYQIVNPISPVMAPLVFLQILFIGGALGEEFGWRGYAFDKLQKIYGTINGTLILGSLWSLWHLPLFFMLNTVQSHIPIWQFMLQNTLMAFFYTWVYNRTKGNMLLMILLHAVLNTSAALFPYWQTDLGRYLGIILLLLTAIIFRRIIGYLFQKPVNQ